MAAEINILSPVGMIGYGFPETSLKEALKYDLKLIAVDAGSTDPGPYYLGIGKPYVSDIMLKRDLSLLLPAAKEQNIPLVIGTAGGSGSRAHVNYFLKILREVVQSIGVKVKVAVVYSDLDRDLVIQKLRQGLIESLDTREELTEVEVQQSTRIVAQMGVEPLIKALETGADVVIAGRAYDPAVFAAYPIMKGYDRALALHAAKIIECGAKVAEPMTADCIMARLREDYFLLQAPDPRKRCLVSLTAAHSFYEKPDALFHDLPGGMLDLSAAQFEQFDERRVKVWGAKFIPSDRYLLKLEGVKKVGYRTICIGGIRDPIAIQQIEEILSCSQEKIGSDLQGYISPEDYQIVFHLYGRDGVMGSMEPLLGKKAHELGLLIQVVGKTQKIANTVCALARSASLHWPYTGRMANAGNIAFPFSPAEYPLGEVFEFNIFHLLQVDDPCELFPLQLMEFGP